MSVRVGIIGGGIAGVTCALRLANEDCDITLFEKEPHLISGPPFCHLHAGGNLYREIDDHQCRTLLEQSIDFARRYPFCVDYRPTLITVPRHDPQEPRELLPRLEMLQDHYQNLVSKQQELAVLGDPKNYFRIYDKSTFLKLKERKAMPRFPQNADDWVAAAARIIDPEAIRFPVFLVEEYGLNLFRLASGAAIAIQRRDNIQLYTSTRVDNVQKYENGWKIRYMAKNQIRETYVDYLINAAGFRTGVIDEMIGLTCNKMVEFKAAYIARWEQSTQTFFPEIIFHGQRGTPKGMAQFTPYPDGYIQLHAMRNDATLYDNGLVAALPQRCQPRLPDTHLRKIDRGWSAHEVETRTRNAVAYLSNFIPDFKTAGTACKPLYGAQQIPGDNPTLRVAEASFPVPFYARCEIVKVSSVGDMCRAIVDDMVRYGLLSNDTTRDFILDDLDEVTIDTKAKEIAIQRGYPESMAKRNVTSR